MAVSGEIGPHSTSLVTVEKLLDSIWQTYDVDLDGNLNAIELRNLFSKFIGQDVSEEEAKEFLNDIDKDGNGLIDKPELGAFIKKGLRLSQKSRTLYASRGEFHKSVIAFFDGIDREILRQNKNVASTKTIVHQEEINRLKQEMKLMREKNNQPKQAFVRNDYQLSTRLRQVGGGGALHDSKHAMFLSTPHQSSQVFGKEATLSEKTQKGETSIALMRQVRQLKLENKQLSTELEEMKGRNPVKTIQQEKQAIVTQLTRKARHIYLEDTFLEGPVQPQSPASFKEHIEALEFWATITSRAQPLSATFHMAEQIQLKGNITAVDGKIQNVHVANLKTPDYVYDGAILRSSDIDVIDIDIDDIAPFLDRMSISSAAVDTDPFAAIEVKETALEKLLDSIWQTYDVDLDGNLNAIELRNLFSKFIGQDVSEEEAKEFLNDIDKDGNGLIDKPELGAFIKKGLRLSQKSRTLYASRGEFHKSVIAFFDGIDREIIQRKTSSRAKKMTINPFGKSMEKYWAQRYRFFSRFDEGIQTDAQGLFSVTPEAIGRYLADQCHGCKVIVDGFCGIGGNAVHFANSCDRVIAIDNDPVKIECAKANAAIYSVDHKINFILGDFFDLCSRIKGDVVYLAPPWGGPEYEGIQEGTLHHLLTNREWGSTGMTLIEAALKVSENVAILLPRNVREEEVFEKHPFEKLEYHYLNTKKKTACGYFGPFWSSS